MPDIGTLRFRWAQRKATLLAQAKDIMMEQDYNSMINDLLSNTDEEVYGH